jgi:hypothetical protein
MQRDQTRDEGAQDGGQDGIDSWAGSEYGFSGRGGFVEGNYSAAYGRGSVGARDNPSVSGVEGAGTSRGGNSLPTPDPTDDSASDAMRLAEGRRNDHAREQRAYEERGRSER